MFEILKTDLSARIGIIHTNHGKIETPAYVPVIHPVKQTIPSKKIKEMGFDLVITNAYITRKNYGSEAERKGIHKIIDFDGAIMTDSGGYQVLEYGDVDVLPPDMANFEKKILTDFAIPLDKPTGFGLPKKKAQALKITYDINPPLFDEYNIKQVPVIVSNDHKMTGHVTLKHALEKFKERP